MAYLLLFLRGMGFASLGVGGRSTDGVFRFLSAFAEPTLLASLAVAAGSPLLLLPGPAGMLLSVFLDILLLWFNHRLESSVRRLPVRTGAEALRGQKVVVQDRLTPFGSVRLGSEIWKAVEALGRSIEPGDEAVVLGVQGLMLEVVAIN